MTFARDLANLGDISNNINFSNALINGSFSVSQRATSFTSGANNDDAYTLDRWYILSDGNDAIDVTQDTSTVPTNGQFAIALDVETVNKKFGIAQIVENKNCLGLIGNTVTFSFKAKEKLFDVVSFTEICVTTWPCGIFAPPPTGSNANSVSFKPAPIGALTGTHSFALILYFFNEGL
jgi:hypothetical protein